MNERLLKMKTVLNSLMNEDELNDYGDRIAQTIAGMEPHTTRDILISDHALNLLIVLTIRKLHPGDDGIKRRTAAMIAEILNV